MSVCILPLGQLVQQYKYINIIAIIMCILIVQSIGVSESTTYIGLVYYEKHGVKDLMTFTIAAVESFSALYEVCTVLMCSKL